MIVNESFGTCRTTYKGGIRLANGLNITVFSSLAPALLERCNKLGLKESEKTALTQVPDLYDLPMEDALALVEDGISVARLLECCEAKSVIVALDDVELRDVNKLVEMIGFSDSPDLIEGGVRPAVDRILHNGRQLTLEQYRDQVLGEASSGDHPTLPYLYDSVTDVIETLAEAAMEASFPRLMEVVEESFDGNILQAHEYLVGSRSRFLRLLAGEIDRIDYDYLSEDETEDPADKELVPVTLDPETAFNEAYNEILFQEFEKGEDGEEPDDSNC